MSRNDAFAARLLARWDRRVASPRPLGLVLARPLAVPAHRRRPAILPAPGGRGETHVRLEPRISLTLLRPGALAARPVGAPQAAAGASAASSANRTVQALEQLVLRTGTALSAERAAGRAAAYGTRVEKAPRPAATPGAAGPAPADGRLPAPPLAGRIPGGGEIVVRRDEPHVGAGTAPERQPAAAFRPAPPSAPQLDLGRLTDQVVSAIDARLAAQAERLGRS